jgi:hypothetical protein
MGRQQPLLALALALGYFHARMCAKLAANAVANDVDEKRRCY